MWAPLIASLIFVAITCIIAEVLRIGIRAVVKDDLSRLLFLEFLASAELCAACFELIIVAEHYGVWVYAAVLFALTIWWCNKWHDESGCPYINMESYLGGETPFNQAFLCSLAQLAGGLAIYKYVQYMWSLEITDHHVGKSVWDCETDLQVTVFAGAIVEGIATCLCRLASRALADLEPQFASVIDSFVGTGLVVAACNYSGGYFNPVLATSLKMNCRGHTNLEHFVVYWVGAFAGSALSYYLYKLPAVKALLTGGMFEEEKKAK